MQGRNRSLSCWIYPFLSLLSLLSLLTHQDSLFGSLGTPFPFSTLTTSFFSYRTHPLTLSNIRSFFFLRPQTPIHDPRIDTQPTTFTSTLVYTHPHTAPDPRVNHPPPDHSQTLTVSQSVTDTIPDRHVYYYFTRWTICLSTSPTSLSAHPTRLYAPTNPKALGAF